MSERLNVKNLVVDSGPSPAEYPFNPAKDLTPSDMKMFESYITRIVDEGENPLVDDEKELRESAYVKTIGGKLPKEIFWIESMKLQVQYRSTPVSQKLKIGSWLATIGVPVSFTPETWQQIMDQVQNPGAGLSWDVQLANAARCRMLGKEPRLHEVWWNLANSYLKHLLETGLERYASHATYSAILGKPVELSELQWDSLKILLAQNLKMYPEVKEDIFLEKALKLAYDMSILAADRIAIPPGGGLHLVFNEPQNFDDVPSLPETRHF